MKKVAAVMGALFGLSAMGAQAGILDLGLGHNSFRGAYSDALTSVLPSTISNSQFDVGLIAKPRSNDDFYQVHGGLVLTGDPGLKGVNVGVGLGGRVLYVYRDGENGGALALGGQIEARIPNYDRLGITASSYFAPSVLSIGRLDRSWENAIALDYELIHGGAVYVGYRNLRQDIGGSNRSSDSGVNLGLRLKF
ncbi:MAG: YfaZ family outer membrane protein [Pseudomonadota bacterium]